METQTKYPILDDTGKVKTWLDAGRGVAVWRSQLIGEPSFDVLTPGDATDAPGGWRFRGAKPQILTLDDVVLLVKNSSVKDFTSSAAGLKAAHKYADTLPKRREVPRFDLADSPARSYALDYTIEEVCMESREKRADGQPLALYYRYAVIEWSGEIPKAEALADAQEGSGE